MFQPSVPDKLVLQHSTRDGTFGRPLSTDKMGCHRYNVDEDTLYLGVSVVPLPRVPPGSKLTLAPAPWVKEVP